MLSAIEGLDTFTDMMENTDIGSWYGDTKELVNKQKIEAKSAEHRS